MPSLPLVDPYVGPRPFGRADGERFFGREGPTEELFSLIVASRVVVFYGQSGTGKSSLVNAGLRPLLETDRFDILPTARVQGGLPAERTALQLGNPYAYFTLLSWGDEVPDVTTEGAMARALAARPRPTNPYGDPASRLLIFDQFEELFTSFPACWAQRSRFAAELANCVASDERLRILFVVREDHLADVLSLTDAFPDSLRSSMRLPLLGKEEATEAIEGPLSGSDFSYADGVVEELIDDLTRVRVEVSPGKVVEVPGGSVEPVQLQVVCTELWHTLPPGTTVITSKHLRSLGDVTTALAHFYDDAVRGTASQVRLDSIFVRRWIGSELITPAKTRGTAYRGILLTAGLPNTAVDTLEDRHLIRAETRAGARWYELTHDRFLRPIEQANVRAMSRGLIGYWGLLLPAAVLILLVVGVWVRYPWQGLQDVSLRVALALIATAGIVEASWTFLRRRLRYWISHQRRLTSTLLISLTESTIILVLIAGLIFLIITAMAATADPFWTHACHGSGAMTALSRPAGFNGTCLHQASETVDLTFAFTSVLVALLITYAGSRLSRRRTVRKWRRLADQHPDEAASGEPGMAAAPNLQSAPRLTNNIDQLPRDEPVKPPPFGAPADNVRNEGVDS